MAISSILVLNCSPRHRGNSFSAYSLVLEELHKTPQPPSVIGMQVRDFSVLPCVGCDTCHKGTLRGKAFLGCPKSLKDSSQALLEAIEQAGLIFLVSPIYNYHFPSQFKAVLDRLQPFFWQAKKPEYRHCYPIFIAGQPQGEKLFDGALLTLKFSLGQLGYAIDTPLLLRGIDGPNDFAQNSIANGKVKEYVQTVLQVSGA